MNKTILFCIITTLILGNFNFINIAADQEEPNVFLEKNSFLDKEKKFGNEKLEHNIVRLLDDIKRGDDYKNLQTKDLSFVDDKVRLELILSDEDKLDVLDCFSERIEIENHYKSLTQILIPIDLIEELSKEEYVQYIRAPVKPHLLDINSEGVGVIGADLVHNEGVNGSGVKVAIIDIGFQNYLTNPELPSERIAEVISFRADGDIEAGEDHGSACAEIVLDVAPMADLYLYNFDTISELNTAVSRAISVDVDIISFSIAYVNINP